MAEDDGLSQRRRTESAARVIGEVGIADPADLDPHHDLSRHQTHGLMLFDAQVTWGVEDQCFHERLPEDDTVPDFPELADA
ncbi:hypothetical protein Tasa_001_017 [Tanticharoenia sakaeratensis NBRC 103193]|uniref:Uncharacterized protein n=1 Tax=Tanticharoenia sakaeratensis NBRC 103193 TaxID=1231623 RepID=A0A0D6MGD4_9PROT|nr:hypothetical protein Tasa_001_017 [Tanticharoenia sakaeratensis NBRC 103193]GBQ24345.1 hypothetical protein AA103193_2723 [Tanticharoenia sakaeratensis NBRC 103193]